tara:strand:- start:23467 stop:24939 length:1473 start_codon:yes stop_codon:yes gene_type:complete
MKIDRHSRTRFLTRVKLAAARQIAAARASVCIRVALLLGAILLGGPFVFGDDSLVAGKTRDLSAERTANNPGAKESSNRSARDAVAPPETRFARDAADSPKVVSSPAAGASPNAAATPDARLPPQTSHPKAVVLLDHTINRLANGPAFNAKVRQRVWSVGREVVGIGTYEQAGYGSGRFNLQIAMLDGAGKHTLQQISDGRLAWTRTVIADEVSLRRVDVGRLDEWIPAQATDTRAIYQQGLTPVDFSRSPLSATAPPPLTPQSETWTTNRSPARRSGTPGSVAPGSVAPGSVAPRLIVGAWTEMLDSIRRDYVLRLGSSTIEKQPVLVITGYLRESVRRDVLAAAGGSWPEMYPTTVKLAIATLPSSETGFGEGLPIRFEFWCDPDGQPSHGNQRSKTPQARSPQAGGTAENSATESSATKRSAADTASGARLVSLIELFAIHPMTAPPVERFRFENQDSEVNFVNETDRYLKRYGVRITDSQRRLLFR